MTLHLLCCNIAFVMSNALILTVIGVEEGTRKQQIVGHHLLVLQMSTVKFSRKCPLALINWLSYIMYIGF